MYSVSCFDKSFVDPWKNPEQTNRYKFSIKTQPQLVSSLHLKIDLFDRYWWWTLNVTILCDYLYVIIRHCRTDGAARRMVDSNNKSLRDLGVHTVLNSFHCVHCYYCDVCVWTTRGGKINAVDSRVLRRLSRACDR